jgi:PEP-CTERM motif
MKQALLAGTILAALILPSVAHADEILAFGQNGTTNTVTVSDTGGISTTLTASNIPSGITALFGGGTPAAFFDLDAHSVGAATPLGSGFQQNFAGTFSITSGMGQAGINYLSGSFTDLAFGVNTILLVGSSDPPDHIVFTSDVIPASELGAPRGVAFSLSNFNPPVSLDGTTLASGTASITGTFDSTPAGVPEPITLAVLGVGMAGLGYARRQRRAV